MSASEHHAPEGGLVTFVNRFTVHTSPEEFERIFAETSGFMARQDGFLDYTLLRHNQEDLSYINIAHWRDADSFRKAVTSPAFKPHVVALRAVSTSDPNLYIPRLAFSRETAGDNYEPNSGAAADLLRDH